MAGRARHFGLAAVVLLAAVDAGLVWGQAAAQKPPAAKAQTPARPVAKQAAPPAKQPASAQQPPRQLPAAAQPQPVPQRPAAQPTRPARDVVPANAIEPATPDAPPEQPFTLTPQQQANLDRLLNDWEKRNLAVQTITCAFERWEFDRVTNTRKYAKGELNYSNPDNAEYKVFDSDGNVSEHWLCTGKSIYEFKHAEKTLVERQLPLALQGKAIEDGPLPFVFNSKAKKLKERYWLRLTAPPEGAVDQVWLEAFPKRREDKANFDRAELILDAKEMIPNAVQLHMPGGQTRTIHKFKDTKINGFWAGLKGFKPKVGRDWKIFVEPAEGMAEGAPLGADPAQPRPAGPAPVAERPIRPATKPQRE